MLRVTLCIWFLLEHYKFFFMVQNTVQQLLLILLMCENELTNTHTLIMSYIIDGELSVFISGRQGNKVKITLPERF